VLPTMPMTLEELEARAQAVLSPSLLSYVAGGAGDESTQRANVSAFQRWGLVPRMMVGVTRRDLFGMSLSSPLFMAPVGVIGLCAQDGHGDLATARAAARTGVPMATSTLSVDPLEQVADKFGETPGFFALYTPSDRALAESLVHRAAAAGFTGIVVTLDTWLTGWCPCDLAASNFPQLRGHCLANYTSDPLFRARLAKAPEDDMQAAVLEWVRIFGNPLTWDDLAWLQSVTDLPLILKGICHPEDARRARDGGVDVIKALALGATAVGVGRPYAYGLALEGTDGIVHVLRSLLAEADMIMAVDGYLCLKNLRVDGAMRRISFAPGHPMPRPAPFRPLLPAAAR
jgi:lactate 2-monooxygenase